MPSQNHLCKERRYGGGNKETIGLCCKRQKESEQLNPGQAADLQKCVGYPEETHLGETIERTFTVVISYASMRKKPVPTGKD